MSLFELFKIMRFSAEFEAEYEIFGENLEVEDLKEWGESLSEITGKQLETLSGSDLNEVYFEFAEIEGDYMDRVKAETNPSPRLQMVLNAYFEFFFKAYNKGFETPADIEDYNETLFDCLYGSDAKNFEPLSNKSEISDKYFELVENELYASFKDYKLEFMDKFKIIVRFVENYEGRSLEAEGKELLAELSNGGIYDGFFKNGTLGELLEDFADWYDSFLNLDDDLNPISETEPKFFVMDCINWRAL